jgi:spore coat polysaccharide biosynthesis protein SpsF (cytidylyltransferase family)
MLKRNNFLNKSAIILEARTQSKRFPNKIFKKIGNYTLLHFLLKRLSRLKNIKTIVATTKNPKDKKIINFCKKNHYPFFVGKENDLIDRVLNCSKKYKIENIISLTSDNPLVDIKYISKYLNIFYKRKLDYLDNIQSNTFPKGMAIRIVKRTKLKKFSKFVKKTKDYNYRQHTCFFFMQKKNFKYFRGYFAKSLRYSEYKNLRLTVDYKEDLELINQLSKNNNFDIYVSLKEIINIWRKSLKSNKSLTKVIL